MLLSAFDKSTWLFLEIFAAFSGILLCFYSPNRKTNRRLTFFYILLLAQGTRGADFCKWETVPWLLFCIVFTNGYLGDNNQEVTWPPQVTQIIAANFTILQSNILREYTKHVNNLLLKASVNPDADLPYDIAKPFMLVSAYFEELEVLAKNKEKSLWNWAWGYTAWFYRRIWCWYTLRWGYTGDKFSERCYDQQYFFDIFYNVKIIIHCLRYVSTWE